MKLKITNKQKGTTKVLGEFTKEAIEDIKKNLKEEGASITERAYGFAVVTASGKQFIYEIEK